MPKLPGLVKGLGVTLGTMARTVTQGANTVQYHAGEGGAAHPCPRRHRPAGGELHGLHAVRPVVPPIGASTSRPQAEGAAAPRRWKARTVSVLDASTSTTLCMYCGICVEVCPFDALFWSPEYEYSEPKIADLLHDKDKLGEWMETVPEAPDLEAGADKKGKK